MNHILHLGKGPLTSIRPIVLIILAIISAKVSDVSPSRVGWRIEWRIGGVLSGVLSGV